MVITTANVGDVICVDLGARYIQIENVTDNYVQFRQETGHSYATFSHEMAGTVVRDASRIKDFKTNATLGAALANAERSAISSLMNVFATREQKLDASAVLQSVKGMQKHLSDRLFRPGAPEHGHTQSSLDALIRKAGAEAQSQPGAFSQNRPSDRGR